MGGGAGEIQSGTQGVCVNEELKGGAGRGGGGGGQGGCIEVIVKFEEKSREEVQSGSLVGVQSGGGMGGCEQRIEVIVCENAKKSQDGRGWSGGGGGGVVGGSGGCKLRIEGIVKWGVRVQSGVSECMCK